MSFNITFNSTCAETKPSVNLPFLESQIETLKTLKSELVQKKEQIKLTNKDIPIWYTTKYLKKPMAIENVPVMYHEYIETVEKIPDIIASIRLLEGCKKNSTNPPFLKDNGIQSDNQIKFECHGNLDLPAAHKKFNHYYCKTTKYKNFDQNKHLFSCADETKNRLIEQIEDVVHTLCFNPKFIENPEGYCLSNTIIFLSQQLEELIKNIDSYIDNDLQNTSDLGKLIRNLKGLLSRNENVTKYNYEVISKEIKIQVHFLHKSEIKDEKIKFDLKNKLENLKESLKEELTLLSAYPKIVSESTVTSQSAFVNTMNHIQKLLFIEGSSSFKRFTKLPKVYQRLSNRIRDGLMLLDNEKDRIAALNVIKGMLDPEIITQSTTIHRSYQGRHNGTCQNKIDLTAKSVLNVLTAKSVHNFEKLEAAHVIPAPGLLVRRVKAANRNLDALTEASRIPYTHWNKSKNERNVSILNSTKELFEMYKGQPQVFGFNLLNYLLLISSEESSSTVHLTSVFNQEVDGYSEKYLSHDVLKTFERKIKDDSSFSINLVSGKKDSSSAKYYKKLLASILSDIVSDLLNHKPHTYETIFLRQMEYTNRAKLTIAKKLTSITREAPDFDNLVISTALINKYLGIKCAEFKANINSTLHDDEFKEAIKKLGVSLEAKKTA